MSASSMPMLFSGSTSCPPRSGRTQQHRGPACPARAGEPGALPWHAGPRSRAGSPCRARVGRSLHGPRGSCRPSPAPAVLRGREPARPPE
eukprot:3183602-Alexandrium_andersonii.AAC.1